MHAMSALPNTSRKPTRISLGISTEGKRTVETVRTPHGEVAKKSFSLDLSDPSGISEISISSV
jgi:hypothetical protein